MAVTQESFINQHPKENACAKLFKCINFIAALTKWREKSIYTPIDEFIWYLYMDTAYYGYVGAMPNGLPAFVFAVEGLD